MAKKSYKSLFIISLLLVFVSMGCARVDNSEKECTEKNNCVETDNDLLDQKQVDSTIGKSDKSNLDIVDSNNTEESDTFIDNTAIVDSNNTEESDTSVDNTAIVDSDNTEESDIYADNEPIVDSDSESTLQLKPYPKGIYTFVAYDSKIPDATLENKSLAGIIVHDKWYASETKDQTFLFNEIDARIAEAGKAGLAVILGIGGSIVKSPDWVKALPGVTTIPILNLNSFQKDTYCKYLPVPVYWDPIFHAQKLDYILWDQYQ